MKPHSAIYRGDLDILAIPITVPRGRRNFLAVAGYSSQSPPNLSIL